MLELRINHDGKEWAIPLGDRTRWMIGRGEACEIQVPDRRMSAEHAELLRVDDKLTIRRTKGQLPIEINGDAQESAELCNGSSFNIAHTRFVIMAAQDGMNLIDTQTVLAQRGMNAAGSGTLAPVRPAIDPAAAPTPKTSIHLLAQICSLLAGATDKQALAQMVLDFACQRLLATRALLARITDAEHLQIVASKGIPADADAKGLISTTILKQIIELRQAVIIGNTERTDSLGRQDSIVRNHIRAVGCTPVFSAGGKLIALLYVDNQDRPKEFSAQDAELLIWLGHVYTLLDDNLEMRRRLEAEVSALKRSAMTKVRMVAEAPSMVLLLERVKKAAASEAPVLILGDSGTGKECIARMLHQQSGRANKAFVARNCAAIPENLFESEMFGHKKGAFTGAEGDRKGAFSEADGGTLFLDEIGDLSTVLQTKLLRAIQEKIIRPVGSDKDIPVDARIVCATNKDLRECCKNREFREDLYYRIATVTVSVPPLRERREDIVPLARYFAELLSDGTRKLTFAAEERLVAYDWPGNVRELRSIVEQAVIFSGGSEIHPGELNLPVARGGTIDLAPQSLAEAERRHIFQVLQSVNGNKTEAARVLGIARSTLVLKLHSYEQKK